MKVRYKKYDCRLQLCIRDLFSFKAGAHSFERFTSQPFLKLSFSLSAPFTSYECHAWFHLKAARNTEQMTMRLRNFQGSQVFSLDFSTLYTALPHDFIKAKVFSLVNWCLNRESKTYIICTSVKAWFFSNKKYDSYRCWSCVELYETFTFLMENIYVQVYDMVYQQIVGILMGTYGAPLIADLFLYC